MQDRPFAANSHCLISFNLQQDEWVVCRVFMKSSTGKKYPSSQPRANPYNLEMNPAIMPQLMQLDPHHFGIGLNYLGNAELAELSRFARGTAGLGLNLPIQPQLSFPASFALSGLNLNLAAPHHTLAQPQVTSEPPLPSALPNCILMADAGFNANVNPAAVDLEGYWPTY